MGIYDNVGTKRKTIPYRPNQYRYQKVHDFLELFSPLTFQQLIDLIVDQLSLETWKVQSDRITLMDSVKETAREVLNDLVDIEELKRIEPKHYFRRSSKR